MLKEFVCAISHRQISKTILWTVLSLEKKRVSGVREVFWQFVISVVWDPDTGPFLFTIFSMQCSVRISNENIVTGI